MNLLEVKAGIQNDTLKSYEARYEEALAQIGINRSQLFPQIGTQPLAQGVRYSAGRPYFTVPASNPGKADIQLPLTATWEIDLWGKIRRQVNIAREETQASAADRENAQLSVQAELAYDYFELRADDAQTKLLQDTVKNYQEALRITTNRFEGGISNESDVFQAKTQLQAAVVLLQDIKVQRAQYEHAIAVLIGQPPNSFSLAEQPLDATPPVIPAGLPSQLLERRPDIAAAERRAAEGNEQIGIARAGVLPHRRPFGCRRVRVRIAGKHLRRLEPALCDWTDSELQHLRLWPEKEHVGAGASHLRAEFGRLPADRVDRVPAGGR